MYEIHIDNTSLGDLGYIIAVANLYEKHDRSAPSDYHWKILKCRMMIFSSPSILACPDDREVKKIHIIFSKREEEYKKMMLLFGKFSLTKEGEIRTVTDDILNKCFQYTMVARISPVWNTLGYNYLINNRDFLTASGPQDGLQYSVNTNQGVTYLKLKPIRLTLIKPKCDMYPGESVRVLPSLNQAVVEDRCDKLPEDISFKSYKDLKRHWKNIHGYRLPEEEHSYYLLRFWRGDPLTYPEMCVTTQMPIVVPIPKHEEKIIIARFVHHIKNKMEFILREPIKIWQSAVQEKKPETSTYPVDIEHSLKTQAISLCTPTQNNKEKRES